MTVRVSAGNNCTLASMHLPRAKAPFSALPVRGQGVARVLRGSFFSGVQRVCVCVCFRFRNFGASGDAFGKTFWCVGGFRLLGLGFRFGVRGGGFIGMFCCLVLRFWGFWDGLPVLGDPQDLRILV